LIALDVIEALALEMAGRSLSKSFLNLIDLDMPVGLSSMP